MTFKGIRLKLVAVALILCLGIFFAGNYYFNHYRLNNSLEEVLSSVEEIEKVVIKNEAQPREIVLTLKGVDDLRPVYRKVNDILVEKLGPEDYAITLNESTDPILKEAYDKIHLVIYETIITGEFSKLATQLELLKEEAELSSARISVDHDNIYLELSTEQEHLYKVIEREIKVDWSSLPGGGANG
ncbi:hypothetical protein [Fuchsiella alkaliacetigena]|uniref:hypothetical protein n=1 Tax=Fuchsiella alkaliacetigena TaxID=957042 RepID=UPI00200B325C|nr:hypothetical protein [Fuchsiella alkaliacetigena]MCK8824940.1 hypothetical protein [Fuchsiella alkaliacetigena]